MAWTRRQMLTSAVPAAWTRKGQTPPARLNVIFMVSDDMNASLGCYGNPIVKTPHLDRLAARGVTFERSYCQFPLCAPTRASFLSGRRPETTRVLSLNVPTRKYMPDAVMLPEHFRRSGYFTAQVGKIYHTGPEHEDPRSWDYVLPESGKSPPESEIVSQHRAREPRNHSMEWAKLRTPDEQTPDGIVAHKAVELIEQSAARNQPFFIGVGFRRPHCPYAAPKPYFDLYDPGRIPLPAVPAPPTFPPAARYERTDQPPLTEKETREYIAAYYACTSYMDAQAGKVLSALDRLKLWDRTVIVFVGDQGYHTGQHGMWHKMTLFEESLRVPLLIYAPGMKGNGRRARGLVECLDLYPTLVDLCGLDRPGDLEGITLRRQLENPALDGKRAAYSIVGRASNPELHHKEPEWYGRSVRTARWRYTEWDGGRRGVELYDELSDPQEMRNLASDGGKSGVVAEMQSLLAQVPFERMGSKTESRD